MDEPAAAGDGAVVDIEVVATPERFRRWLAVGVGLLVLAVPAIFAVRTGFQRWASLVLLGLAAAIVVDRWERLRLTDDGLELRRWPRQRLLRWDEVASVRIDWTGRARVVPQAPEVELHDGEVVRSGVLAGVTPRFGRRAERDRVLERLRIASREHDFRLEIEPWELP